MPTRSILFDIDGTLLTGACDHLTSLADTLNEVPGSRVAFEMRGERPHVEGVDLAGFIDVQIVRTLLPDQPAHEVRRIMAQYADTFTSRINAGVAAAGTLVPGAREVLEGLRDRGFSLGISTGNAHRIARAKLRLHRLDDFFAFSSSLGFGDVHADRTAAARAAIVDTDYPAAWCAIVGDTAADMRAARATGARGIGVLTGAATADELRTAGAVDIIGSVADLPTVL